MPKLIKIRKMDGSFEFFEENKIESVIIKAIESAKGKDSALIKQAKKLAQEIIELMEKSIPENIVPSVHDVEDVTMEVLKKHKLFDLMKSMQEYKLKKSRLTEFKTVAGVRDDIGLSENAIKVLAKRYLLRNESGEIIETPKRLFERVAKAVSSIDSAYKENSKKSEKEFLEMMLNLEFLPNTPTLMNAGTQIGQLSACFVLPIEDSLKSILHTAENSAIIHQSGGGTGFNFSKIRPKNDIVKSTKGVASGPVSFMRIYDVITDVIKQGGKRRGANMSILNINHPDIKEFITVKSATNYLKNFNISVAVTDEFMEAVEKDLELSLVNPRTNKVAKKESAKELFNLIVENAWKTGDPGLVFIDEINRSNPTPAIGRIESTNPCGEQPLLAYECCNLGSINLAKMFVNKKFSWEKFRQTICKSVHFLDNVIDANRYPMPEIEMITKANRKIGLGIMGFAETLIKIGIPYNSKEAVGFAQKISKFLRDESHKKSQEFGQRRGSFPNFQSSIYSKRYEFLRNATLTTIAPTGTISIIADCTSGIEPLFAIAFTREILEGTQLLEVNREFKENSKEKGFYSKALMSKIARRGSVQGIKEVPKQAQRIFVTALDIDPEYHVKIQSAFQEHTDNAVSKTVNLPENATVADIKKIYMLAYKLKSKGITVYRYGSKENQVISFGKTPAELLKVKTEYSGGCPGEECAVEF